MSKSLADYMSEEENENTSTFFTEKKETSTEEKKECKLASVLFKARTDTHITHLLQKDKTLATHLALGSFYETLNDQMDTFIESYMGLYPLQEIEVPACGVILNPVKYLTELFDIITEEREKFTEGYLLNQIDSLHELIAHTLYKLKHITT